MIYFLIIEINRQDDNIYLSDSHFPEFLTSNSQKKITLRNLFLFLCFLLYNLINIFYNNMLDKSNHIVIFFNLLEFILFS